VALNIEVNPRLCLWVRVMTNAKQTLEQRSADVVAAQKFHQIQKFAAARRRHRPGAMNILRPDSMITTEVVNSRPTRGEPRKDGSVRRTNLGN
jgi:hypothetical protein